MISRGNYRKDLFTAETTGAAFEKTIFEAVERCGWKLHAYVIMSNHYHLAVETPEPNLVDGMRWLQSERKKGSNAKYKDLTTLRGEKKGVKRKI